MSKSARERRRARGDHQEVRRRHPAAVGRPPIDYRDDVRIGDEILAGLAEGYRKIRNTVRYVLGTLDGFDPAKDAVPVERARAARPLGARAARRLGREGEGRPTRTTSSTSPTTRRSQFCAVELSALYFDVLKDRLYTWKTDGRPRRSAQTVLHLVAEDLVRLLAPVLSFTAERGVGASSPARAGGERRSSPASPRGRARPTPTRSRRATAGSSRSARSCRGSSRRRARAKLIGSGLEAMVTVRAEGDAAAAPRRRPRRSSRRSSSSRRWSLADGPARGRGGARPRREVRALLDLPGGRRAATRSTRPCAASARTPSHDAHTLGKWTLLAVLFVVLVVADQWTKYLAVDAAHARRSTRARRGVAPRAACAGSTGTATSSRSRPAPYYVWQPVWRMNYVENPGAAWGLFRGFSPGFRNRLLHPRLPRRRWASSSTTTGGSRRSSASSRWRSPSCSPARSGTSSTGSRAGT